MMNPTDEHLQTYLAHYGEALSAGDLKAISDCYALPSLVLSDAGSVPHHHARGDRGRVRRRGRTLSRAGTRGSSAHPRRFKSSYREVGPWTCGGTTSTSRGAACRRTPTATWFGS